MAISPSQFLIDNLGRRLAPHLVTPSTKSISSLSLPVRSASGETKHVRCGGVPFQFFVTEKQAVVVGKLRIASTNDLTVVLQESEMVKSNLRIAHYLLANDDYPFMYGDIGLQGINNYAKLSRRPSEVYYLHPQKPAMINMTRAKSAIEALSGVDAEAFDKTFKAYSNYIKTRSETHLAVFRKNLEKHQISIAQINACRGIQLFSQEYFLVKNALQLAVMDKSFLTEDVLYADAI